MECFGELEEARIPTLWQWKQHAPPACFLTAKPHKWRALFAQCLESLELGHLLF